ncbi:matrixin family metalloprotease [Pseudonocardia sp. N23]|uniref:matrixin family metalloprotease n=1 Tax=Pseudonocardia sp. N23 TaxID=1987376 RepID=UPI000BFCC4B2|nr:matrixin family metalloprotease [Pseudonocardia sp. N23]GAY12998.1 cell surface protein [Pseudonocardia sp. N23]
MVSPHPGVDIGTPRCSVTDPPGSSGLHPSTYGPPAGRWPDTTLTYSISVSGGVVVDASGNELTATAVRRLISDAFELWADAWSPLTLTRVSTDASPRADIRARFVGTDVEPDFADTSVLGNASFPPKGRIRFTTTRNFTERSMRSTAIHEMGHALGLTHSGDRTSMMYPWNLRLQTIDQDSRDAINAVYVPWSPQEGLPDRGTEDRPALAAAGPAGFGGSSRELSAVWRGASGDRTIYHSRYRGGSWTAQERIPDAASTHGPALAQYSLRDGTASTGLIMLWKGSGNDSTLWWNVNPGNGTGWTQPHRIPDVGTSAQPALAYLEDTVAAWKGVDGDTGIYWAPQEGAIWQPQERIPDAESSHGPALAVLNHRLYLFFRDPDDSTLWYTSRGAGRKQLWTPRRIVQAEDHSLDTGGGVWITPGSSDGPAAATHLDRILLAWKGAGDDSGIYWCAFNGTEFSPQLRVDDAGTSKGPGLGSLDNWTYMMWKGVSGDNTLWWSQY